MQIQSAEEIDFNSFENLEELRVRGQTSWCEIVIPALTLSKLRVLDVIDASLSNISRLWSLKKFRLWNGTILNRGPETLEILLQSLTEMNIQPDLFKLLSRELANERDVPRPGLRVFRCARFPFRRSFTPSITQRFLASHHLELRDSPSKVDEFFVNEAVKVLDLSRCQHLRRVVVSPSTRTGRRFLRANLSLTHLEDYSPFRHIEKLVLAFCPTVTDASIFADIPFLNLYGCENIRNFRGLGPSQKYLDLNGCVHLQNSDLLGMGDVEFLNLSHCSNITDVSPLMNNFFLFLEYCHNLQSVILKGSNFVLVSLKKSRLVNSVTLCGKIQSLHVEDCPELRKLQDSKDILQILFCS